MAKYSVIIAKVQKILGYNWHSAIFLYETSMRLEIAEVLLLANNGKVRLPESIYGILHVIYGI